MTQRRSFLYRKPTGSMMMGSPKESILGEDMAHGGSSRIPRLRRTGSLRGPRDKYPSLWETIPERKEPSSSVPATTPSDPRKHPLTSPGLARRQFFMTDRNRSLSYSGISGSLAVSRRPQHLPLGATSGGCSYPHTPTPSPESVDDCDSVRSFGSNYSSASCDCVFAKNGTTFSGRKMKYVVHCARRPDNVEEYLTPTQRAQRQIRHLKILLSDARKDIQLKDAEIFKLTKELVELRLYNTHDEDDGDKAKEPPQVVTTDAKMDTTPQKLPALHQVTPDFDSHHSLDIPPSLADSGNYEDFSASPTVDYPKDPMRFHLVDIGLGTEAMGDDDEDARARLVASYERQLEELKRSHAVYLQELKEKYNDKIEGLLQKLSDMNARYCELRPQYEQAQERIWELEKEMDIARKQLEEEQQKNQKMYLKMYMKGQEAAKFEHADHVLEFAHQAPMRVSVPELLQQLQVAETELDKMKGKRPPPSKSQSTLALLNAGEAISLWMTGLRKALYRRVMERSVNKSEIDPEVTLQFLKSAIYYFLTDRENHKGHLTAIESILGYNEFEKLNIEKAYKASYKR